MSLWIRAPRGIDAHPCRAPSSNTICDSESRRSVYGARAPRPPYGTRGVRARLRAVGQAPRAGLSVRLFQIRFSGQTTRSSALNAVNGSCEAERERTAAHCGS